MKESLFTCTFQQSEKLLREYHYYVKSRGVRTWLWLGILLFAGSIAMYIFTRELLDLLLLLLGVYFGYTELTKPAKNANKQWGETLAKHKGEIPETTVTIDEEKAVSITGDVEITLHFEDVLGLYFCKTCVVLQGFQEDILITNESVEDMEAFKKFLDEQCQNAPVYRR